MKIISIRWVLCIIFLIALIVPVLSANFFEGGDYPISGCSFDLADCSDKLDPIELRPNLRAVAINYSIIFENQSRLDQNFRINLTFWKVNYTRFGNEIAYHSPGLIGSYEGTDLEGYRIFDTQYEPNRTNYDFFLLINYSNLNYGDNTNRNNREFGRLKFDLYRINEGESLYPPAPVSAPIPMPVEQLNQKGQNLTFVIIRGNPFTFTGTITQPRIAKKANITQARFWIFGDHYAEAITVPVNRVNGSFNFSLGGNETKNLNSSEYRLFTEYPTEWNFFPIHISSSYGFVTKGLCACDVLFSLTNAHKMNNFEAADRFEDWVNGMSLQTPMYKTTIKVLDPAPSNITIFPAYTWDSRLQSTSHITTATPENVSSVPIMSDIPVTTQKTSLQFILTLIAICMCCVYWRYRL